jgi:hypothetical protein
MMTNPKSAINDGVLIGRGHWDVPVRISITAYLRFSRRMDHQLHRLVVRWSHLAPPSSRDVANKSSPGRRSYG